MIMHEEIHTLNSYFHNVVSVLKYIKEDAFIKNDETKEMLEMALQKEDQILEALNKIISSSKKDTSNETL
jgi:hypothetical protein